jgi:hypothetical protein
MEGQRCLRERCGGEGRGPFSYSYEGHKGLFEVDAGEGSRQGRDRCSQADRGAET